MLPDEWEFPFYRGKLAAKMGASSNEVLHLLARACHDAAKHRGGLTEPLYRLHATRLKLLLAPDPPLDVIAAHPFLPETLEMLESECHAHVCSGLIACYCI